MISLMQTAVLLVSTILGPEQESTSPNKLTLRKEEKEKDNKAMTFKGDALLHD